MHWGIFNLKRSIAVAWILCISGSPFLLRAEEIGIRTGNADLVWVADGQQGDGGVYFAARHGGNWSEPLRVSNDNARNLHPCIYSSAGGKKWLVWTAIEQGTFNIHYAVGHADETWSIPEILLTGLSSNFAPTVIVDDNEVPWVVWSGNNGIFNDEIYFSRFIDGKWEDAQLVNDANNVPDIKPVIAINEQRKIQVTWDGYRDGNYLQLRAVWSANGQEWEKVDDSDTVSTAENKAYVSDQGSGLPDFVKDSHQFFLREYPNE